MSIDAYFLKKTKDLAFIELKTKEHPVFPAHVSLPLWTDTLVAGVRDGAMIEEVPSHAIWEGLVAILGMDANFTYNDIYVRIMRELHDDPAKAIMGLAAYYNGKKDLLKTAIALRALLYMDPYHEDGMANLAAVYAELAELETNAELERELMQEATRLIEALWTEQRKTSIRTFLVRLYMIQGQYLKAKLTLAEETDDADGVVTDEWKQLMAEVEPLAQAQLIENSIKAGRIAEAECYMDKAWETCANEPSIIFLKSILLFEAGESEEAFELLEELITNHPQVVYYNQFIAQLYAKEKYQEALDVAIKGVGAFPEDTSLMANLAMTYVACGEIMEGEAWMERAIDSCSDEMMLHQLQGLKAKMEKKKSEN